MLLQVLIPTGAISRSHLKLPVLQELQCGLRQVYLTAGEMGEYISTQTLVGEGRRGGVGQYGPRNLRIDLDS